MSTKTTEISKYDDMIDVRDVIARVERLREARDDAEDADFDFDADAAEELRTLTELLDELKGYGGDEQWCGDWYPVTLIRDTHFKSYAQEFAEDVGAIDDNARWPCTCIDWDQAARELQGDYSSVEFYGMTYWYR